MDFPKSLTNSFVPVAVRHGKKVSPVEGGIRFKKGDELTLVIFHEKQNDVVAWLLEQGWNPTGPDDSESR